MSENRKESINLLNQIWMKSDKMEEDFQRIKKIPEWERTEDERKTLENIVIKRINIMETFEEINNIIKENNSS